MTETLTLDLDLGEVPFVTSQKIHRLFRDMIISEKIDGTQGVIYVSPLTEEVKAGSKNRWLGPGEDNFGFGYWVASNQAAIRYILGPGLHHGEWWGKGIQRRYGLDHRRFSLFNVSRWGSAQTYLKPDSTTPIPRDYFAEPEALIGGMLTAVPTLYVGAFNEEAIRYTANVLESAGSHAAPCFMKPEGIVIYHTASNSSYKFSFDGDGHKGESK